jgi:diadenosine tetraphosphate (Ap4A) HIT family hydrolase
LTDLACVFCDIIARKAPAHIVYEGDDLIAFLDSRPITDGHTLLVTKRHYERLGEIPEATVAKLFTKAQELNETIMKKMSAQGANISVNDGKAAHQLVPHIHVHIIPRKANDGVTFSARKRLSPEQMEHIRTLIGT